MSAKGRGTESVEYDYYPTPPWCVDRLLDREPSLIHGMCSALEPSVGDGAIVRAVEAWCSRACVSGLRWTGVELRGGALRHDTPLAVHVGGQDFRTWEPNHSNRFDIAIGNPPFSIAEGIVRRCLGMADVTAMLLRVGFLGSSERLDFWHGIAACPALRVLPNRPSFDGKGTDSSTYAWFVWGHPGITGVRVLDETPAAVRSAQKPPDGLSVDPRQASLFTEDAAE